MEHRVKHPADLFNDVHTTQGYIPIGLNMDFKIQPDIEGNCLYCMFQGSNGAMDWFNNLLALPQTVEPIEGCGFRVHRGFNRVWQSGGDYILCALEGWLSRRQFQDFKVVFSGFSHGGPLAMLACNQWFHQTGRKEDCVIFGSPKLAFGPTAVAALQRSGEHTHWFNQADLVVHVPPRNWPFEHVNISHVIVPDNRWWSFLNISRQHQIYGNHKIYPNPLPRPWAA